MGGGGGGVEDVYIISHCSIGIEMGTFTGFDTWTYLECENKQKDKLPKKEKTQEPKC